MSVFGFMLVLGSALAGDAQPKDAKPLDDLARLQGTWEFTTLEIDGQKMPPQMLLGSRIEVAGNNFTTYTGATVYKGIVKIDPSQKPKTIDMIFSEGPEKGTTALGIYELDGDHWKLCLTIANRERPKEFATKPNSGLALETLKPRKVPPLSDAAKAELAKFAGEWTMESGEINGQKMPDPLRAQFKRTVKADETLVMMGDQVFMRAQFAIDPAKKPKTIDYLQLEGPTKGAKQLGIYEWDGERLKFCFASPGQVRPADFSAPAGSGRTASMWKRVPKN